MAASYDRLTRHTVYTSRAGCPAISSVSSPQSGPNATAALQAIANLASPSGPFAGGPLEIVVDQPLLVSDVSLYSGTTIRGLSPASYTSSVPGYGLWMAAISGSGTQSCILRNANWASNYGTGIYTPTNITDHDITVKDLYLDGQYRNSVSGSTNRYNPNNGYFLTGCKFYGVANLRVQNVYVYDPCNYGVHAANIQGGQFIDITGIDTVRLSNPTGTTYTSVAALQFCGPWDQVTVDGLFGTTGDDFLAFNMVDGNISESNLNGFPASAAFGGYSAVYYGSGGTTFVRRLRPTNCLNAVRILYGSDPRNSGSNPTVLSYISISDVAGSIQASSIGNDPGSHFGAGSGGSVTVLECRDWGLTLEGASLPSDPRGFGIPPAGQVILDNIRWQDLTSVSTAHQVSFQSTCNEITLRDCKIYEDSSEVATPAGPLLLIASGNTIGGLTLEGCKWIRNANTSQAMVSMTGGTISRGIKLTGVEADNINNVLSITGGTVEFVNCSGLSHYNANSNPSISLGSGVTVPRLRAAGSDTAQLVGGSGTVTSEKTDSTQDS